MNIEKEQNLFKKTMLDQHGEYNEEHFELDSYGNFSWIGTDDHFEIWMLCAKAKQAEINELKGKLAKAQAVQEGYVIFPKKQTSKMRSLARDFDARLSLTKYEQLHNIWVKQAMLEAQEQNQ